MAKKILLVLSILLISSSFVFGQVAITGQIRGVATDANGGVLPNVSISAKSPALMTPRKTTTDVAGSYLFDSLPPGIYELTYTSTGLRPASNPTFQLPPASLQRSLSSCRSVRQSSLLKSQLHRLWSTRPITRQQRHSTMHFCRAFPVVAIHFRRSLRPPALLPATSMLPEAKVSNSR